MTDVQLHHLSKSYDDHHRAVSDLCLTMPGGRITAVLGPSGCGKTTLLKLIAGLLPPDQGDITFAGHAVTAVPPEKRAAVMVFQNHLLFPHLTVYDNIAFGLKMRGEDPAQIRQRVGEMLEMVRLPGLEKRQPSQLSGGQQQRVALARALIVSPRVLLLDEPLSNLDAHLRNEMRDLIVTLQRQLGITTVIVTHDQEEAVILADHLALMFDGVLQQEGPPSDFYERPLTPTIARFFGGVNFIPGHKQGPRVETAVGDLWPAGETELPDGPVIVTIRPENVQLGAEPGRNTLIGCVLSHLYAGTHTRFQIQPEPPTGPSSTALPTLQVVADAASQHRFQDGDRVCLSLPPDKLWLMADER